MNWKSIRIKLWRFCHAKDAALYRNIFVKFLRGGFLPDYLFYRRWRNNPGPKVLDEWFDDDGNLRPNA